MGIHTAHLENADGEVRQYGFHYGTDREVAYSMVEESAKFHIRNGAKSMALRDDGVLVRIFDSRDFS